MMFLWNVTIAQNRVIMAAANSQQLSIFEMSTFEFGRRPIICFKAADRAINIDFCTVLQFLDLL